MPPTPDKDLKALSSVGEDAAVEEGLPPPQENAFDNDGDGAAKGKSSTKDASNRLSVVSQQYDRENKGFLDDAQARMRELDVSNRGYLTNDRVYNMMKEQLEMQKQMVTQKRLIIGLFIFSVVLALANMGTAFAAATLAKDTTVSSGSAMVSTANGGVVGTGTIVDTIKVEREDHSHRRYLGNHGGSGGGTTTCDGNEGGLDCTEDALSIPAGTAANIYNECGGGDGWTMANTVNLETTCGSGRSAEVRTVTLCKQGTVPVVHMDANGALVYTYTLPDAPDPSVPTITIDCTVPGNTCSVTNFCPTVACQCSTECWDGWTCCTCDHCIPPGSTEVCGMQICCADSV